ncbi:MAG TPA: hypothetical protein EYQ83_06025, partial [Acidobacteria bacterium]|nr:hypothetical protein [Acidobacteriota bacterium]
MPEHQDRVQLRSARTPEEVRAAIASVETALASDDLPQLKKSVTKLDQATLLLADLMMDAAMEAVLRQRRIEYQAARELSARKFRSKVKLAEAEAYLEVAKAG